MRSISAFHRCFTLLALAGALSLRASAMELSSTSPFLPVGSNNADANATPAGSPLELHGIVAMPDGYRFNLYDPTNHADAWVGFNEPGHPFVVHAHDIAHNRVTVEYQGRELTLTLPQPKIVPMPAGQQAMPVPQPMNMGRPPAMTNANPEEERRRLERITEEIRRRRALRAAQQQQSQPAGNPTPPVSVPQPKNY